MARRARKARAAGLVPPSQSAEAWALVDLLLERGWNQEQIAAAARLSRSTVRSALARRGRWSRGAAARLLQIDPDARPCSGLVDATGTRRRLRALTAIGWTSSEMGARCGLSAATLANVSGGRVATVNVRTADAVAVMYRELCMTPGPSSAARRRASCACWAPPLAWDDDLDDPAAEHRGTSQRRAR